MSRSGRAYDGSPPRVVHVGALGRYDFRGYVRRLDGWEYRAKRLDMPRDSAALLELARDIELEERIILDRTDNDE